MDLATLNYINGLILSHYAKLEKEKSEARKISDYWAMKANDAPDDAGIQEEYKKAFSKAVGLEADCNAALDVKLAFAKHDWR